MGTVYWTAIYSRHEPLVKIGMIRLTERPAPGRDYEAYAYPRWDDIVTLESPAVRRIAFRCMWLQHPTGIREVCLECPEHVTAEALRYVDGFVTLNQYDLMKEMEKQYATEKAKPQRV